MNGDVVRYPLERLGMCRIGRGTDNAIVLPDELSSREHAMIRRDALGFCHVSDMGSRNGTRINHVPISIPTLLRNGDRITIGRHDLLYHEPVEPAPPQETKFAAETQVFVSQSLMTVLVMDIRGYTVMSQRIGQARVSEVMSAIFQATGEMLRTKRRWSQKYIGDAVMAVWVHPGDKVPRTDLLDILDVIAEFGEILRPLQARFDLPEPLRYGCAVNSGYAAIGNFGDATITDFTAMGDAVNKGFRLEKATKEVGCDVLIGHATLDSLTPTMPPERMPLTQISLRSYEEPESVVKLNFADLSHFAGLLVAQSHG
jgi:adenylate cyclase